MEITKRLHPSTHMHSECVQMPWGWSSGLIPPVLQKDKVQLREWAREAGRVREKRVVFADLILTTSPGRAFPWNRFAIPLLFIQVVGESSEICREHAFCNTSLWILNTCSMSNHTGTHIHKLFIPGPKSGSSFIFSCDICRGCVILQAAANSSLSVWISKSSSFTRSKSCQTLLSSGIVQWVLASWNGGLWLARMFGCGAVSCNNIHLARVQARGRLQ